VTDPLSAPPLAGDSAPVESSDFASTLTQIETLREHLEEVVVGKPDVIRLVLTALVAGGHILLEDVPGVGKTLVGKALARSLHGQFVRLQLTPDLLPSDIIGTTLYDAAAKQFVYSRGPIFANVLLADEINRTTPRTQSALLEAMSDGQVSIDGVTHELPRPFIVIATQNPYEFEGTYPLPESQLDRFLLRMRIGYPSRTDELKILETHRDGEPVEHLSAVLTDDDIVRMQRMARSVRFEPAVANYLLDLIAATRSSEDLQVGASTRAALAYYRAAQAAALIDGRDYVLPDDVKRLAVSVLAHRVIARGHFHAGQRDAVEATIHRIVEQTAVPD
jgi:MoxR-like ATPase